VLALPTLESVQVTVTEWPGGGGWRLDVARGQVGIMRQGGGRVDRAGPASGVQAPETAS